MESQHERRGAPDGAGRSPRRRGGRRLATLAAVAVGGALGAPARVEIERILPAGPALPWGTFAVNVVGSFLLAAGAVLVLERLGPTRLAWPAFATGFCGAFTTMSSFAVEVDLHIRSGDAAGALAYAAAAVAGGLLAAWAGTALVRAVLRRKAVSGSPTPTSTRRQRWS